MNYTIRFWTLFLCVALNTMVAEPLQSAYLKQLKARLDHELQEFNKCIKQDPSCNPKRKTIYVATISIIISAIVGAIGGTLVYFIETKTDPNIEKWLIKSKLIRENIKFREENPKFRETSKNLRKASKQHTERQKKFYEWWISNEKLELENQRMKRQLRISSPEFNTSDAGTY